MLLQYRAAAVAGFGTQVFWGLMRIMIFEAFYRSSSADQPMTFPQVVTYVWLGQAMLAMFPWNVDADIPRLRPWLGCRHGDARLCWQHGFWHWLVSGMNFPGHQLPSNPPRRHRPTGTQSIGHQATNANHRDISDPEPVQG
jgi:hypothetical protein